MEENKLKKLTAKIYSKYFLEYPDSKPLDIYTNISSVDFEALDRGDVSNVVSYGIYSNKGTLTFFDYDRTFYDGSKEDVWRGGKVEIYLSSDVLNRLIGTFQIDDYEYNQETKEVSVNLVDQLITWQGKTVYTIYKFYPTSLYGLIDYIFLGKEPIKMDTATETYLDSIYIDCTFISETNLWDVMTQICEASMCRIFCDPDGSPRIHINYFPKSSRIIVRPYHIFGISDKTSEYKTKIPSASISLVSRNRISNSTIASIPFVLYDVKDRGVDKVYTPVYSIKTRNPNLSISSERDEYNVLHIFIAFSTYFSAPNVYNISQRNVIGNEYSAESVVGPITEKNDINLNPIWENTNYRFYEQYFSGRFQIYRASTFGSYNSNDPARVVTDGIIEIKGNYFEDGKKEEISYSTIPESTDQTVELATNDLIQTESYFTEMESGVSIALGEYILSQVKYEYSSGVECLSIECSFDDYYYRNGSLALSGSGKNKEIESFKKYDIITPYVVRNGFEQPYSTNNDGTPKSFIIIGIKYSYYGVLKQKLYLQEYKTN